MKKGIVFVLSLVVVLLGLFFGFGLFREEAVQSGSLEKYDVFGDIVSAPKWDDEKKLQNVLRVKSMGEKEIDATNLITYFSSEASMSEIVEHNKEIYVGPHTLYSAGIKRGEAELFFIDNNYYALLYDKEADLPYSLYNCCSASDFTGDNLYVPMPVITYMSKKSIDFMREDLHKNYLWEDIYQFCTFEQAKIFYKRMDSKYVKIDEESKIIEVQGYSQSASNYFTPLQFDFAKQTLTVKDKNGKQKVYNGK